MPKILILFSFSIFLTSYLSSCKKQGCTDPLANNYNSKADKNDNSCQYDIFTDTPDTLKCSDFSSDLHLIDKPGTEIDYIFNCYSEINVKVTIDPGVVIAFKENSGFDFSIYGKLFANGTTAKPIRFTA